LEKEKMPTLIKNIDVNFTQVNNNVILDIDLTYKAKGIYAYLVSRPDNWKFYINNIVSQSSNGKTSVQSGIKELEEAGYLERKLTKDNKGKITGYNYIIYAEAKNKTPSTGKPRQRENTVKGKTPSLNNTEVINNTDKEKYKKEKKAEQQELQLEQKDKRSVKKDVQLIFDFWNEQDIIKHRKLNKEQIKAIETALKQYGGIDRVCALIARYSNVYHSDYFFDYSWRIEEFLKRKTGISEFDDEGSKFKSFCKWKSKQEDVAEKDEDYINLNTSDPEEQKKLLGLA